MFLHCKLAVEKNAEITDDVDGCDVCVNVYSEVQALEQTKARGSSEAADFIFRGIELESLKDTPFVYACNACNNYMADVCKCKSKQIYCGHPLSLLMKENVQIYTDDL